MYRFASVLAALLVFASAVVPASAAPPKPDKEMQAALDALKGLKARPAEKLSPAVARQEPGPDEAVKEVFRRRGEKYVPEAVAKVESRTVPGPKGSLPVRVYTPKGEGPFPLLLYVHGGGWVLNSIAAYDASYRAFANEAKCVVVSVGYHLAPENPFPGAHEEVYAAGQYILKNADKFGGDPARVAIAGESAGGNMAAAFCLMARDRKGQMPKHQVLIYPVTDTNQSRPSYKQNAKAVLLYPALMEWFFDNTLQRPGDRSHPYFAVLRNKSLRNLPPATIITADLDVLRDEGRLYAERLRKFGVPVRYKNYMQTEHEFVRMNPVLPKGKDAVRFAAEGLKTVFAK